MKRFNITHNRVAAGIILLASVLFSNTSARADINIGGDVYGGGKQGAVGTANVESTVTSTTDAAAVTTLGNDAAITAVTNVTVNSGKVRTVFGGGENGRVYGKTQVTIGKTSYTDGEQIAEIGGEEWDGTIHGGVFGAGDGAQALVFGHNEVTIQGGKILNNVYGGGNQANMYGATNVTLKGGTVLGNLFGGARMADIMGRSFVNIDGANAVNDLIVKGVYGGNDISGTITYSTNTTDFPWTWLTGSDAEYKTYLNFPLTTSGTIDTEKAFTIAGAKAKDANSNPVINATWNAYVYSTPSTSHTIFVGNLFGGGNGDYKYVDGSLTLPVHKKWNATDKKWENETDTKYAEDFGKKDSDGKPVLELEKTFADLSAPELGKAYLQLEGGIFGYVYGGGNNATVTAATEIYINNTTSMSTPLQLAAADVAKMDLQYGGQSSSYEKITVEENGVNVEKAVFKYQFDRVFGGNNKAEMSIQPHWYLTQAEINNLYSGGNAGNMTNADGILLNIFQNTDYATNGKDRVHVVNVYGGCRMADVTNAPSEDKTYFAGSSNEYTFPAGYSARVYISGGKITNVYGGNDISGNVKGGTDVEIHGAISGDIYGGGNGSYAYTDNSTLGATEAWKDYYYDGGSDAASSLTALNAFRPNVEKSLVHISGNYDPEATETVNESNRVYVTGRVYCGGNSATLAPEAGSTNESSAKLVIGKNVTMNAVYLGSNGENMITDDMLEYYNNLKTTDAVGNSLTSFSKIDLDDATVTYGETNFDKYLKGVEVAVMPEIDWEKDASGNIDLDYTTRIGAFVCGGNVGSMSAPGTFNLTLPDELVIFDRLVGGCNAANVDAKDGYNPFHLGGVTAATTGGSPKLNLTVDSRLEPRRLDFKKDPVTGFIASDSPLDYRWNTESVLLEGESASKNIFHGANIYGGCYTSGYVNGDVTINIRKNLISPDIKFIDDTYADDANKYQIGVWNETDKCYDPKEDYVAGLRTQRDYIFASTLAVYGGGYGENTEIWGDVNINLTDNAGILKVYGGGEQGVVGHINRTNGTYQTLNGQLSVAADGYFDTKINMAANLVQPADVDKFNVGRVYGGGFQGVVTGNTALYLGGGKVSEAIAGAANADIYGYTEMFIGKDLAGEASATPFLAAREEGIRGNVYGGNDFGGKIWGAGQHYVAASGTGANAMAAKYVTSNTYVEYDRGLVGNSVYGGACGSYNYKDNAYAETIAKTGFVYPTLDEEVEKNTLPNADTFTANTFVNVASQVSDKSKAFVGYSVDANTDHGAFFGGGKGYLDLTGIVDVEQTYVLLHSIDRDDFMTPDVYGGGFYSNVNNTMVDAYTGNHNIIYGGTYGATANQTADTHLTYANYANETTTVNVYPSFQKNPNITIYGSGGYAGTGVTNVNLFGGKVGEVYGGSLNEGYCGTTNVNVFNSTENANTEKVPYNGGFSGASTVVAKAIFGGSKGADPTLPCDVNQTNVNFHSESAYVTDGIIYGGNNFAGASKSTLVDVTVPIRTASDGQYVKIVGGGNGINSIAGFTNVNLNDGAVVSFVYGGAAEGKTYNQYDLLTGKTSHNAYGYYYQKTANSTDANATDKLYAHWITENWDDNKHTNIMIAAGATVRDSVYAGGWGEQAVVAGNTSVTNYGTVRGKIFGGGYAGSVRKMVAGEPGFIADNKQGAPSTTVNMLGGVAQNIYGGGYAGSVGGDFALKSGKTNEYEDKTQINDKAPSPYTDYTATTNVNIGTTAGTSYSDGVPTILRSVYGGGEKGKVYGTANTTLYNGFVGYEYRACTDDEISSLNAQYLVEDDSHKKPGEAGYTDTYEEGWTKLASGASYYFPNLKLNEADADNLLTNNGNLFGAGYGEGAVTEKTLVQVYGGTVRNGLYGGGEIAAVGFAEKGAGNEFKDVTIQHPGYAHVEMFDGLVCGSVFGGGRGFSYDLNGGVVIGSKFYSDGYTFGQTEVGIHGGVIGTDETLAQGDGNVFGGGNIGYVYSGHGTKKGEKGDKYDDNTADGDYNGFYYKQEDGNFVLTEDCKVVISPYCKVTGTAVTIDGCIYQPGEYVPTEVLNTITNIKVDNEEQENPIWNSLDQKGIVIRNAVFAGGNVTMGSDIMFIETTTVFGNVTASLVDLFSKDLVTLGNDDVGGLYGDGNLTFVDGYRELNISNYGTDYYSLNFEITYEEYQELNNRQRAYFSIQYKCLEDNAGHSAGEKVDEETYNSLKTSSEFVESKWERAGFCSIYAGRMMNTVQRADFCGVFGSRMVMKGAQDRVPAVVDYTKYTINRVGEVSLNQKTVGSTTHGNYFGMYSVVNYLGALSSDVKFTDVRTTQSSTHSADGTTTYKEYKKDNIKASYRNNGESANIVAMASGVFLELVHEPIGTATSDTKDYGPITGVIQLDLISVKTGEGGGYVYAKNEHGFPTYRGDVGHLTLTKANEGAVTQESYTYADVQAKDEMQTSGNFVHSTKRIVDDCFPKADAFYGEGKSPAHYWYVKGDYYVYDQYISAYTGSSQSYAETINLPLVIQAASNGRLKIETIQTSKYAYFDKDKDDNDLTPNQNSGQQIEVGDVLYGQNEPISYWDYSQLASGKENFLDVTYVCPRDIIVGGTLSEDGESITGGTEYLAGSVYKNIPDISGKKIYLKKDLTEITADVAFHVTNGVSNANGLLLAVSLDNPYVWDEYHTTIAGTDSETKDIRAYKEVDVNKYILAPSYYHNQTGSKVYGQSQYLVGEFVPQKTVTDYDAMKNTEGVTMPSGQAVFDVAYVAKEPCDYTYKDAENKTQTQHVVKGGAISQEVYEGLVTAQGLEGKFSPAFICTETTKLAEDRYVIVGETYSADEITALQTSYGTTLTEVVKARIFDEAYLCTTSGAYGGRVYAGSQNFSAIDYTALSKEERKNFTYNWDALDVLSNDKIYSTANMQDYDKDPFHDYNDNLSLYSKVQSLDYEAKYTGESATTLKDNDGNDVSVSPGQVLSNIQYENLLNEKANYVYLNITYLTNEALSNEDPSNSYTYKEKVYISEAQYNGLTAEDKAKVTVNNTFHITKEQVSAGPILYDKGRVLTEEEFNTVNDKSKVHTTDALTSSQYFCVRPYGSGTNAKVFGDMISTDVYNDNLKNYQKDFTISGSTPVEKSTLYVTKDINPFDVTQDRIVTVIYNYTFTEADEEGTSFENVMERHVLNIHIHFENGVPTIGDLIKPAAILPGSTVGLNVPVVTPGAFEVLGGGFEVFESAEDAQSQKNGVDWKNYETPMYWYQNEWYVAYYAETYLGKTYSNAVPFTVANYHTLDKIMGDKDHHYYVDNPNVQRNSKIYLDNHECTSDATKSELDLLKDFFDLSLATEATDGHQPLDKHVKGGADLEFILNSDVAPKYYTNWTSIGTDAQCFEGNLHGNGHTVTGLNKSLFGSLCGNVYNLGVEGSIAGAGIADNGGYAENCWLINESMGDLSSYSAVIMGTGQIENCYYNDDAAEKKYATGTAIYKPMKSFLDGEVAYNLNRFYLRKRFADANITSGSEYKYYTIDPTDGSKLVLMDGSDTDHKVGYYSSDIVDPNYSKYDENGNLTEGIGYVEHYYMDGDYIYSGGTIPTKDNERYDKTALKHYPIYPDDYIFFGQKLTYNTATHDNTPTAISKEVTKDDNDIEHQRIVRNNTATDNRVYRAPAYFQSKAQDKAYYNRSAAFVAQYTPAGSSAAVDIYKGMTAIDFTGANDPVADHVASTGAADEAYAENQARFYAPLLDYEGLTAFRTNGLTQNLLVYAPAEDSEAGYTKGTHDVLETALPEPDYTKYSGTDSSNGELGDSYGSVAAVPADVIATVKGHLVNGSIASGETTMTYQANGDQFLVDRQDFNSPIAYTFRAGDEYTSGDVMWYQRKPVKYAEFNPGTGNAWETIVLPFTANAVTTSQKGEVTHFYGSEYTGHEYWLRGYTKYQEAKAAAGEDPAVPAMAVFNRPASGVDSRYMTDAEREVANTFLWDYYYSQEPGVANTPGNDKNADDYQTYYNEARTYNGYQLLSAGVPYIIAFPGKSYYEFDMSGQFTPKNTATHTWSKLGAQTITYLSDISGGITIPVTDDIAGNTSDAVNGSLSTTKDGYTLQGTFLNHAFTSTDHAANNYYQMDADGTEFAAVEYNATAGTGFSSVPFRAYFTSAKSGSTAPTRGSILIGNSDVNAQQDQPAQDLAYRDLIVHGGDDEILIESTLEYSVTLPVYTTNGKLLRYVTVLPMSKGSVPVKGGSLYLVGNHKVLVK